MYAAEAAKRKDEIDTRNQGDQIVYQTETAPEEAGAQIDPALKSEIDGKLQSLKTALTGTDTESIKKATAELTDVFGKIYQQAQAAGFDPSQAAGGDAGTAGGQDYYDADYTVVDDDKK